MSSPHHDVGMDQHENHNNRCARTAPNYATAFPDVADSRSYCDDFNSIMNATVGDVDDLDTYAVATDAGVAGCGDTFVDDSDQGDEDGDVAGSIRSSFWMKDDDDDDDDEGMDGMGLSLCPIPDVILVTNTSPGSINGRCRTVMEQQHHSPRPTPKQLHQQRKQEQHLGECNEILSENDWCDESAANCSSSSSSEHVSFGQDSLRSSASIPPVVSSCEQRRQREGRKPPVVIPDSKRVYLVPTDLDVLFGRGGLTNNHPGNNRLHEEKLKHYQAYLKSRKSEKKLHARALIAAVHAWGGRFLQKDETNQYYEVDIPTARKKASQVLREAKKKVEEMATMKAKKLKRKDGLSVDTRGKNGAPDEDNM